MRVASPLAIPMMGMEFGVDLGAPTSDLPMELASLPSLCPTLKPSLLVTPLAHPRYCRDHKRPRSEPMTRSDLLLSSNQWGKHIVGKLSPWLQLDSPHEAIRRRSEEAFKAEVAWAAHLGLQAVLLPPPPLDCTNYARLVQWACASTQHLRFFVRVAIAADDDEVDNDERSANRRAEGPWHAWDRLRTLCEQSASLSVALELGMDLPEMAAELERWCGEPIAMLLVPTSSFLTNKKGFPTLSKRHQAVFGRLADLKPSLVVCGRKDGRRGEGTGEAANEGIGAYLQYLAFLLSRLPPKSEQVRPCCTAPYHLP